MQYAALYQVFHEFHTTPPRTIANKQPNTKRLADQIELSLKQMLATDCDDSSILSHDPREAEVHRLKHLFELDALEHSCELLTLLNARGDTAMRALADVLAGGRRSGADTTLLRSVFSRPKETRDAFVDSLAVDKQRRLEALLIGQELETEFPFKKALVQRISRSKARDLFVAGASRPETGWIGTASIVVSSPKESLRELTGGHNLDAKLGQFVEDATVPAGSIRIARVKGERVLHYNPADQAKLPALLRDAAKIRDDNQLARSLAQTVARPPIVPANRSVAAALHLDAADSSGRGLTARLIGGNGLDSVGWGTGVASANRDTAVAGILKGLPGRVIHVERSDLGFYRLIEGQTGRVYQARSMTDVLDAVTACLKRAPGKPPTKLLLAGFGETDAINFRRSAEQWMKREQLPNPRVLASAAADAEAGTARMFEKVAQADLARAQFGAWEARDIELMPGRTAKVWETTIEAPHVVGGFRGFLIRIRLYFASLFPSRPQLQGTESALTAAFTKLQPDATLNEAAAAIERELRLKFPSLDSVVLEVEGVLFVDRGLVVRPHDARPAE